MTAFADWETQSNLYAGHGLYVPPCSSGYSAGKVIHEVGRLESQWERELRLGETRLTFDEWMKAKGLR